MTSPAVPHVSICICTFRRRDLLRRLLTTLNGLKTDGRFTYSIVVADNDREQSARETVAAFRCESSLDVVYCVEPVQNLALVRNRALAQAGGDYVAFIDDDEVPISGWLLHLLRTCGAPGVTGVLGPVLPHFDDQPPAWVRKCGFYDRPRHPTGFRLEWRQCRTGNVLFRRSLLEDLEVPFREEFRTGGEDRDFFRRAIEKGHAFIWCNQALAFESVPPSRWTRRFMLKRALLRGRNSLKHPRYRLRNVVKSLAAVPAYSLALPFLQLGGHHFFMKYLIKLCDHIGRLLALANLNPVRDREM